MTKMDRFVVVVAQHAEPLQRQSGEADWLFDDDSKEFLFSGA
jgi:hypothetical protein